MQKPRKGGEVGGGLPVPPRPEEVLQVQAPLLALGDLLPGADPKPPGEGGEDLHEGGEEVARLLLGPPRRVKGF